MTTGHAPTRDSSTFHCALSEAELRELIEERIREHAEELVRNSKGSDGFGRKVSDWFLDGDLAEQLAQEISGRCERDPSIVRVVGDAIGFPEILQALATKCETGVVSVDSGGNRAEIHLEGGLIRYIDPVRSTLWEDSAVFYSSEATIERDVLDRCLETSDGPREESLFVALFQSGIARFDNLPRLVLNLGLELVCACLEEPGSLCVEFHPRDRLDPRFAELGLEFRVARFLLLVFSRVDEWTMLRDTIYARDPVFAIRRDEAAGSTSQALTGEYAEILRAIDGERGIDEVAATCRLSVFETLSGIYSLLQMRIVEIRSERCATSASNTVARLDTA